MTSIRLSADVLRLNSAVDSLSAVACPTCRGELSLHQPDEAAPDLLLAACQGCRSWLMIDLAESLIVRLPDRQSIRKAGVAFSASPHSDPRPRSKASVDSPESHQ